MNGINGKEVEVKLTPKELYEKYKGFKIITAHGDYGVVVGYSENYIRTGNYCLIASIVEYENLGWLYIDDDDIIPDHKGNDDDRAFLYIKEEEIVK